MTAAVHDEDRVRAGPPDRGRRDNVNMTVGGAAIGAGVGAALGDVVPGAATLVGAVVGAGIGALVGAVLEHWARPGGGAREQR